MSCLSVIIPSKNIVNLLACIAALRECEPDVYIDVIDDGLDLSLLPSVIDDEDPKRFIHTGNKPFNFARNCNLGIRAVDGSDIVLLNDDALLRTPGGLSAMHRLALEDPEFGVIGAVTNITGQPLQHPQRIGLREVPHFAFVCVLIPRRTIDQVGYLDERYCLDYGCEDRDYCEACKRAGLKVGVFDGCFVDHGSLTSTYRGHPLASRSYAQNQALFDQKWANVRH